MASDESEPCPDFGTFEESPFYPKQQTSLANVVRVLPPPLRACVLIEWLTRHNAHIVLIFCYSDDCQVLIKNCPKVPRAKEDKLKTVIAKLVSKVGKAKTVEMPFADDDMSLG